MVLEVGFKCGSVRFSVRGWLDSLPATLGQRVIPSDSSSPNSGEKPRLTLRELLPVGRIAVKPCGQDTQYSLRYQGRVRAAVDYSSVFGDWTAEPGQL